MRLCFACLVAIGACSSSALAQSAGQSADSAVSNAIRAVASPGCSSDVGNGEIVVCGKDQNRFRIPKELRTDQPASAVIRSRVALDANDRAPCGLFQGERRCRKSEAAQYGYGGGRDPITFIARVIDRIASSGK